MIPVLANVRSTLACVLTQESIDFPTKASSNLKRELVQFHALQREPET
jgi:hypothetical protein